MNIRNDPNVSSKYGQIINNDDSPENLHKILEYYKEKIHPAINR
jgi:hypothetical protein